MRPAPAATLTLALLVGAATASGHPGLHEQEAEVERAIATAPENVDLYVQRGQILVKKGDWDGALASLEEARRRGAEADRIDLLEGSTYLRAQWPQMAKARFETVIARSPKQFAAVLGRARAWKALDHPELAAGDFERAFEGLERPTPTHVLEWQQALLAAGQKEAALAALDRGAARIGPVPGVLLAAVDLSLELGRPEAALARLDQLLARSPDQPVWLLRRGEILRAAGREQEARDAYEKALTLVQRRSSKRNSTRFAELEQELRAALATDPSDRKQ